MNVPTARPTPPSAPLSADEYQELAHMLDDVGLLDIEGVLGFLHAVAIAPGRVPPDLWMPTILAENSVTEEEYRRLVELLWRQYKTVSRSLQQNRVMIPEAHEEEASIDFAEGFVAAAELDPEWRGDDGRWSFAEPLAYLAHRFDLVSASTRAAMDAKPTMKAIILRDMAGIVSTTNVSFKRARGRETPPAPARSGPLVGRNDPCRCGSGKKYKRCCGSA